MPCLVIDRETMQFDPESDCWVHVTAFLRLAAADPSVASSDAAAAHEFEQAVSLYRGSFLEGFSLHDSPPFEQWALVTRERLQRQVIEALARLSAYDERCGEYRQALAHARQQLDLEPWREGAHRQVMRALALSGQRDAALAQYEACVCALREELEVEPAAETTQLYEAIRAGQAMSSPTPLEPGARTITPPPSDMPNSYKGLRAFQEADAPDFFGREALTRRLLARLGSSPGGICANLALG